MILKIIMGKGARGLLNYVSAGAGHARPDFTNMAGSTPKELAREVGALRRQKPGLKRAVAHLILSHDPSQKPLSKEEWEQALNIALKEHGASSAPHAGWLHEDKEHTHLHVFFLRIDAHGKTISDSHSYKKNEIAAREIERQLGLKPPIELPANERHGSRSKLEKVAKSNQRKGIFMNLSPLSIWQAVQVSVSPEDLENRLKKSGVEVEFKRREGGEIYGWNLRQQGGDQWAKGSTVGRELSWNKVAVELAKHKQGQVEQTPERPSPNNFLAPPPPPEPVQVVQSAKNEPPEQEEDSHIGMMRQIAGLMRAAVQVGVEAIAAIVELIRRLVNRLLGQAEAQHGLAEGALGRITSKFEVEGAGPRPKNQAEAQARASVSVALDQTVEALASEDAELLPEVEGKAAILAAVEAGRQHQHPQQEDRAPDMFNENGDKLGPRGRLDTLKADLRRLMEARGADPKKIEELRRWVAQADVEFTRWAQERGVRPATFVPAPADRQRQGGGA